MSSVISAVEFAEGAHELRPIDWQSLLHAPVEELEAEDRPEEQPSEQNEPEEQAEPPDSAEPAAEEPQPEPQQPSLEELLQQARSEGEAEGFEKGRRHAEEAVRSELAGAIEALRSAASSAAEASKQQILSLEREVVLLALAVAERIVRRELDEDDELAVRIVKEALAKAASASKAVVRISPRDMAAVQSALGELRGRLRAGSEISVEADEAVPPGGCLVVTDLGEVNAILEDRIGELRRALLEAAPGSEENA